MSKKNIDYSINTGELDQDILEDDELIFQKTQSYSDIVNIIANNTVFNKNPLYFLRSNFLPFDFPDLINYSREGFVASQLDSHQFPVQTINNSIFFDPVYDTDSYKKIKTKTELEFKKHKTYISTDIEKAKKITENIIEQLSFLTFEDISVELTPSNAVKFKILLDDDQLITITKPFEDLIDLKENEVVFNFYIKRHRILSDVKDIIQLVQGINKLSN
jgi:hypothetical protein